MPNDELELAGDVEAPGFDPKYLESIERAGALWWYNTSLDNHTWPEREVVRYLFGEPVGDVLGHRPYINEVRYLVPKAQRGIFVSTDKGDSDRSTIAVLPRQAVDCIARAARRRLIGNPDMTASGGLDKGRL